MSGAYFLTSSRLGFRLWSSADMPLAISLWSDPRVTRFIAGPLSEEAVVTRLKAEIESMAAHKVQYWPAFELVSGVFAGCAGLRPYRLEEDIYELGFHLRPAFWGQGMAEEAARAVIGFAFGTMRARSLFAGHHPENAASRRILEKLGFRYTHKEIYSPTGMLHPSYLLERPNQRP